MEDENKCKDDSVWFADAMEQQQETYPKKNECKDSSSYEQKICFKDSQYRWIIETRKILTKKDIEINLDKKAKILIENKILAKLIEILHDSVDGSVNTRIRNKNKNNNNNKNKNKNKNKILLLLLLLFPNDTELSENCQINMYNRHLQYEITICLNDIVKTGNENLITEILLADTMNRLIKLFKFLVSKTRLASGTSIIIEDTYHDIEIISNILTIFGTIAIISQDRRDTIWNYNIFPHFFDLKDNCIDIMSKFIKNHQNSKNHKNSKNNKSNKNNENNENNNNNNNNKLSLKEAIDQCIENELCEPIIELFYTIACTITRMMGRHDWSKLELQFAIEAITFITPLCDIDNCEKIVKQSLVVIERVTHKGMSNDVFLALDDCGTMKILLNHLQNHKFKYVQYSAVCIMVNITVNQKKFLLKCGMLDMMLKLIIEFNDNILVYKHLEMLEKCLLIVASMASDGANMVNNIIKMGFVPIAIEFIQRGVMYGNGRIVEANESLCLINSNVYSYNNNNNNNNVVNNSNGMIKSISILTNELEPLITGYVEGNREIISNRHNRRMGVWPIDLSKVVSKYVGNYDIYDENIKIRQYGLFIIFNIITHQCLMDSIHFNYLIKNHDICKVLIDSLDYPKLEYDLNIKQNRHMFGMNATMICDSLAHMAKASAEIDKIALFKHAFGEAHGKQTIKRIIGNRHLKKSIRNCASQSGKQIKKIISSHRYMC